jgi:hypothetical protein
LINFNSATLQRPQRTRLDKMVIKGQALLKTT